MKIVWLCHFFNEEIRDKLNIKHQQFEGASWIPNTLRGFENINDIEINVIAPLNYLNKVSFINIRNINYYFIPTGIPIIHYPYNERLAIDAIINYKCFRKKVQKIISKINPDLINLMGAENAYYSSAILDYENLYPVLIMIQGFISQIKINKFSLVYKKRVEIEKYILSNFKYFIGDPDSEQYILKFNRYIKFYNGYFPINELLVNETTDNEKRYDCIFYGRLTKTKGLEDFIYIMSELKKIKPDIKGCIVGAGDLKPFKKIAIELDCLDILDFKGFQKDQKDLFNLVRAAKVFLVPTYYDRLPSTIREAMWNKVPVVAYSTGSIPMINKQNENIKIVKTGDHKEMTRITLQLLNDEKLRNELAEKAYKFAQNEFSLKVNTERIINAYHSVIKDFNKKDYK